MSSLEQRRETPRRRTGSRMHPGWACFLLAWFSGMFTMATMIYIMIHMDWGFWFGGLIALGTFIAGGRKAEKLYDR